MLYREWDQMKDVSGIDVDAIPGDEEAEGCYIE